MAGRSLNISLVATLTPLEKSLAAVGKMMSDFAQSISSTDSKLADSIKSSVNEMNTELAKVKQSFDNVGKNGDDAGKKAGGSLRTQLRQATIEAQKASEQFGRMSPQFIEAARKAAMLKDEMGDVAQAIDAMNPDEKFKAVAGVLQGVAGGFMAVEGAMAAFGIKSESAEKTIAKLQGLMAFSQGLNQLGALKDSFGALGTQIRSMTQGLTGMKAAIAATGIGLIVVAVGLLAANWDKVTQAVDGVTAAQKAHYEVSKKQAVEADKQLKIVESSENIYKLQGKSEREILNIKILATKEAMMRHEIEIKSAAEIAKTQIAAAKRNHDILAAIINSLATPIVLVLKTVDLLGSALGKNFGLVEKFNKVTNSVANVLFDPEEMQKKADEANRVAQESILEMQNKIAGYQVSVKAIDKKAADDKKKLDEESLADLIATVDKMMEAQQKEAEQAIKLAEQVQAEKTKMMMESQRQANDAIQAAVANQKTELELYKKYKMSKVQIDEQFEQIRKSNPELSDKEVYDKMATNFEEAAARMVNAGAAIQQTLANLAVNGIELLATSIGELMTGGGSLESFFNSLILMVADAATQLGKQFVQMGMAALVIQTQLLINPGAAIAAGATLIAVSAAAKGALANMGKQKKMAMGGIAYGPTNALVGEYSGASNNPEVVAPLDKLQGILMRSMGGGSQQKSVQVHGLIQGNNLQVITVKQGRTFSMITGRKAG